MPIQITLNGETHELADPVTVRELLERLEVEPKAVAVEVDEEIVPKSEYASKTITGGETVEIIRFYPGG